MAEVPWLLRMCGRYGLTDPREVVERFGFVDWSEKRIEPRFNIVPSQETVTIVQLPLQAPTVQTATWGLQPAWLDRSSKWPAPINARAESLASSAMFREARRCLIPASGFYEWCDRQPMHIHRRDGSPFAFAFAFAGLWCRRVAFQRTRTC